MYISEVLSSRIYHEDDDKPICHYCLGSTVCDSGSSETVVNPTFQSFEKIDSHCCGRTKFIVYSIIIASVAFGLAIIATILTCCRKEENPK